MELRRMVAPLLLVAPFVAFGCGDNKDETQRAPATGIARDEAAAEQPDGSHNRGTTMPSEVRSGTGAVKRSPLPPAYKQLQDDVVGYSLRYPHGWKASAQPAGSTAFIPGARCKSVQIVDLAPPPGSGLSSVLHSFVQICARKLSDHSSIDDYMRRTYGDSLSGQFEHTSFAGARAYESHEQDQTVIFLQANDYRMQVYASVGAERKNRARRQMEVRGVLRSFSLLKR
jgi:hypothetical protein